MVTVSVMPVQSSYPYHIKNADSRWFLFDRAKEKEKESLGLALASSLKATLYHLSVKSLHLWVFFSFSFYETHNFISSKQVMMRYYDQGTSQSDEPVLKLWTHFLSFCWMSVYVVCGLSVSASSGHSENCSFSISALAYFFKLRVSASLKHTFHGDNIQYSWL